MNRIAVLALAGLAAALGGCASTLAGVGGTESYACKAPVGAQCTSVSGVYANASRGMSEVPRPLSKTSGSAAVGPARDSANATPMRAGSQVVPAPGSTTPAALRSSPRVLRLWVAPWEDADGDLHDASFVHVVVDTGHWLVDRVRPPARSRVDVATPPLAQPTAPAASTPSDTSAAGARPQASGGGAWPAPDTPSVER
jgi:conjugal transfer pilus assembly protein TraV